MPVRTSARSSSTVTARTPWVRFSLRHWSRRRGEDRPCPLGGKAGHAVDPLVALLARLLDDPMTRDDKDLARPRPDAVSGEQCPRRQAVPFAAPVAEVEGLRGLGWRGQVRRRREDRRAGVAQARLVVLHVPKLQRVQGLVGFFRALRGATFVSSALMDPISATLWAVERSTMKREISAP